MNLVEGLSKEIARVQSILDIYNETPGGQFAGALMSIDIANAHSALGSGDVVAIARSLETLKEYTL